MWNKQMYMYVGICPYNNHDTDRMVQRLLTVLIPGRLSRWYSSEEQYCMWTQATVRWEGMMLFLYNEYLKWRLLK